MVNGGGIRGLLECRCFGLMTLTKSLLARFASLMVVRYLSPDFPQDFNTLFSLSLDIYPRRYFFERTGQEQACFLGNLACLQIMRLPEGLEADDVSIAVMGPHPSMDRRLL